MIQPVKLATPARGCRRWRETCCDSVEAVRTQHKRTGNLRKAKFTPQNAFSSACLRDQEQTDASTSSSESPATIMVCHCAPASLICCGHHCVNTGLIPSWLAPVAPWQRSQNLSAPAHLINLGWSRRAT